MTFHPRRSVLYMPGSNVRAIEKARSLYVDTVVLDLEDSVAPQSKAAARRQVVEAVRAGGFGPREVVVRINGLDTPWWTDDVEAAAHAKPDAVLVPKVSSPRQFDDVIQRFIAVGAEHELRLWAMLETPLAMLRADRIAAAAEDPEIRLTAFVMGTNDLAKETRAKMMPGRAGMLPWLMTCLAAARAYGVDIIDGVYNDLGNAEGFAQECAQARDLGFDGKSLIHPSQIETCNNTFSPTPDEIAQAEKIIAAFALPENTGKGVVALDGRMIERLHAEQARRTLSIAEAITARAG